jgi:tight adherence protein B
LTVRSAAEAVRVLAAIIRSGVPARAALIAWPREAPPPVPPGLHTVARRVALGDEPGRALCTLHEALGPDAPSLAAMVSLHRSVGADLPAMLDRLADTIEQRAASLGAGEAAAAGAVLSGRVVAALPILLICLSPMSGAPLVDAIGMVMLGVGVALAVAGFLWMRKLIPRPPESEDAATLAASLIAAALAGGCPIARVLGAVADVAPEPAARDLLRVRRRVILGASWHGAMERSDDDGLVALGRVVKRALELGVPVADALDGFAAARRAAAMRAFEVATRRAPVVMAAPLSLCILPAYALLGLGPYVRSLSVGG